MKYKRPTKLPAPEYVDALMNWAQALLDDPNMFPDKIGAFYLCTVATSLYVVANLPTFCRRAISEELPRHCAHNSSTSVPCVRTHI